MAKKPRLSIAADHAGFELKKDIALYLKELGYELLDRGVRSAAKSVDYPDYAYRVVQDIIKGRADRGILVCGTGIGMSIAANRFEWIRAAVVHDLFTAEVAAKHNHANVLCLGGRTTAQYHARLMVKKWLDTAFEPRHNDRICLIEEYARKGKE